MLSQLFARRYLFSPKSHSVINIISGLSVFAIAMPVAAMIILLSVFNGFETLVKSMYTAFDAELTVSPRHGQTFDMAEIDTMAIRSIDGVKSLSFILEQSVLVERADNQATITLRGVDDNYPNVLPIQTAVSSGEYRVCLGDLDRLVIGQTLAYKLGLQSLAESDISIYALRRGTFSSLLPIELYTKRTLPTDGVFTLDLETEEKYALTSLRLTQELFSYPDKASALILHTTADSEGVKKALTEVLGDKFTVKSRYELKSTLYNIMTYEKWGIFFIALLVLLIASFSIVGALAMLIVEKRRDIATLRALGANWALVRSIFSGEGALISIIGGILGIAIGVGISLLQQYFGLIEIPAETLLLKSYPVEFRITDLLAVIVAFAATTTLITRLTVHSMIKQ